jgi:hypothetical protein
MDGRFAEVMALAEALRVEHRAVFGGEERPVPVVSIAEDLLGLTLEELHAPGIVGMLDPLRRAIRVNDQEVERHPGRRRFTVAHEIGHWICHARLAGRTWCRVAEVGIGGSSEQAGSPRFATPAWGANRHRLEWAQLHGKRLEREANAFAASLLMPASEVRAAWVELSSTSQLARLFDVSPDAMQWRLVGLGLVEPASLSATTRSGA